MWGMITTAYDVVVFSFRLAAFLLVKLCFRIQARWLDEMSWISIGYRSAKMLKVAYGRPVQSCRNNPLARQEPKQSKWQRQRYQAYDKLLLWIFAFAFIADDVVVFSSGLQHLRWSFLSVPAGGSVYLETCDAGMLSWLGCTHITGCTHIIGCTNITGCTDITRLHKHYRSCACAGLGCVHVLSWHGCTDVTGCTNITGCTHIIDYTNITGCVHVQVAQTLHGCINIISCVHVQVAQTL